MIKVLLCLSLILGIGVFSVSVSFYVRFLFILRFLIIFIYLSDLGGVMFFLGIYVGYDSYSFYMIMMRF